jgi:acyl dehydratase
VVELLPRSGDHRERRSDDRDDDVSSTAEQLALDALGTTGDDVRYEVTADAIREYAEATDDPSPAALAGLIATPVFAIVPVWDAIAPASRAVATDEARKRVVHYQQDMVLHRPIEVGMRLLSCATPTALVARPNGSSLVIRTETRTEAGELVNEQYVTEFFRGIESADSRGGPQADHRLSAQVKETEPLAAISYQVAHDQTDRYAEASGDRFEIHLDDEAAKRVGLPGRIVHGFCTLAFAARAVCEAAGVTDPSAVRRLAVRFSAPVFPNDELTTRVWELGDGSYGFEATCGLDRIVLKDGRAEIRA